MNIFIDFDHTLYNTPLLTVDMLNALASYISKNSSKNFNEILQELKDKFKRGKDNIYDIYKLVEHFSTIYNFDEKIATKVVNDVISNGKQYLFDDSIPFLESLKKQNHKIYILSYNEKEVYFQAIKIAGSGLLKYVDGMFPITTPKGELPIDFSNSVFIDDKPKDLISIYNKNPFKIFRIRRKLDTYSDVETNLPIPEFDSLKELQKKFN